MGVWVVTNGADNFNGWRFGRAFSQRFCHLSMRKWFRRVRPESEFGLENCLALKTGTLADEEMIVIAL